MIYIYIHIIFIYSENAFVVANSIKKYLKSMVSPLIPFDQYEVLIYIYILSFYKPKYLIDFKFIFK